MGVIDGILGFASNMYALQNQVNANEQARKDQFYFYNDQKAYNDPAAVMNRNRMAGINPYGDFINGQIGQPTPVNTGAGVGEIASNIGSNLSSAAQTYLQKLSYKLQVKQFELETKKTEKEIEAIDQKNMLVNSQTIFQDLVNVLQRDTNQYKIQYSKAEAEDKIAQALITSTNAKHQDDLVNAQINQILSLIGLQGEQAANVRYNTNTYLPEMLGIQKQAAEDTHNLSLEQLLKAQLDNADVKAIDEVLKKIGKDDNSALRSILLVMLMILKKSM